MRYVIGHAGWSSAGWSEDDPTAEEAMTALAAMTVDPERSGQEQQR